MTSEKGSFFFISLMWKSEACGFSFQPEMKKREIIFLTGTMGIEQPSASVALAALVFWHFRQQKNCRYFAVGHEYGHIRYIISPALSSFAFFTFALFSSTVFLSDLDPIKGSSCVGDYKILLNHYSSSVCDYKITNVVFRFCLWLQGPRGVLCQWKHVQRKTAALFHKEPTFK